MNGSIILVIGIGTLIMFYFGSLKSNSEINDEFIDEISEKIRKCPTIDEVIEKIKKTNIGTLTTSFISNYSGPYSSYCYYDTTCLILDGEAEIVSYSKEAFYKIYGRMIKELKNYNIQLIDLETVRFNKIY